MEETGVVLRYIGAGFVPDVPARDLRDTDMSSLKESDDAAAAAHGEIVKTLPKGAVPPDAPPRRDRRWLLKSGLYEPVDSPATKE